MQRVGAGMVREELQLRKAELADWRMESLWSALDKDKSGFVTMQEFGAFMKRGQPEKGPTWKERLQNEQDEKGRQARLEKQTTSGRFISTVEPASAEELQQLSVLLREQLEDPKMWSAVFRKADSDGSGNITPRLCGAMAARPSLTSRAPVPFSSGGEDSEAFGSPACCACPLS